MRLAQCLACMVCLFVFGCEHGSLSLNYVDDGPPPSHVVVVEQGHVCHPGCSHYWDGTSYVVVRRGHRHGPGCGHVLADGRWSLAVSGPRGSAVVHGGGPVYVHDAPRRAIRISPPPGPPNHFVYDRRGSKWIRVSSGHVHGPGCGHVVVEGHWCLHD